MGSNRIKSEEKGIGRLAGDGVHMACVPARKAKGEARRGGPTLDGTAGLK